MSVADIPPVKKHVYTGAGVYGVEYKIPSISNIIATLVFPSGATRILLQPSEYEVALIDDGENGANITVKTDDYSGGTFVLVNEAGELVLQEDGTLAYKEGQVLEDRAASYIIIARSLGFTQDTDWVNGGILDMPLLTRSFDKVIMLLQQMNEVVQGGSIASNWRGPWVTGVPYYAKDIVVGPTGNWYACHITHQSGTFVNDLAAGYWVIALDIVSMTTLMNAAIAAKEAAIAARDIALAAQAAASAQTAIDASKTVLSQDTSVTVTSDADSIDLSVTPYVVPYVNGLLDSMGKPMLHIQERQAYNIEGPAFLGDVWNTSRFNTILTNEIAEATIGIDGLGKITLPAGKYYMRAKIMLYNNATGGYILALQSNGVEVLYSVTEYHGPGGVEISVEGRFLLLNKGDVYIKFLAGAASTARAGVSNAAGSIPGITMNSIYADAHFWKIDDAVQH